MRNVKLDTDNVNDVKRMTGSYEDSGNGIYNKYNYRSIEPISEHIGLVSPEVILFGVQRPRSLQSMYELYKTRMSVWNCGVIVDNPTPTFASNSLDVKFAKENLEDGEDEIIVIPLRDVSYDEAKHLILDYIQKAGTRKVYMSDIAEELKISLRMIIRAFRELGID